jgi:hypothetical protein
LYMKYEKIILRKIKLISFFFSHHYISLAILSYVTSLKAQFTIVYRERVIGLYAWSFFFLLFVLVHRTYTMHFEVVCPCARLSKITTSS